MDLGTFRGKLSLFLVGTIVLSLAWIGGHLYRDYSTRALAAEEGEEVVIEPAIEPLATVVPVEPLRVGCHGNWPEVRQELWFPVLCQKILAAVTDHPSPEIHTGLAERIRDGRVIVLLEAHVQSDIAGTSLRRSNLGTDDLTMNFSPDVFRDRPAPDPLLTMVLYHEYQHVKQIEVASEFREDFRFQNRPTDEAGAVRRFGYELDAYEAQCRFSAEFNLRPTNHCSSYPSEGRRGLTTYLIENNGNFAGYRQAIVHQYAPWMLTDASTP